MEMIWHKDMSLVLNIIKPQKLIQNIQIIACMKKAIYKCYRYGLSWSIVEWLWNLNSLRRAALCILYYKCSYSSPISVTHNGLHYRYCTTEKNILNACAYQFIKVFISPWVLNLEFALLGFIVFFFEGSWTTVLDKHWNLLCHLFLACENRAFLANQYMH